MRGNKPHETLWQGGGG